MHSEIVAEVASDVKEIELISGTGEVLEDVNSLGRERDWVGKKKKNLMVAELFQEAQQYDAGVLTERGLARLYACGTVLKFAETPTGRRLAEANFCQQRFCPMCNWRRSLKMYAQVSRMVRAIEEKRPTVRFLFLTLTIRNVVGSELSAALDSLNLGYRKLMGALGKTNPTILGDMKCIEVTYNRREDSYHPHIHAMLEVRSDYFKTHYISQKRWGEMWQECMGLEYSPIVDIRPVCGRASAVAELSKYPLKLLEVTAIENRRKAAEVLIILKRSLHGRKLVAFRGELKEVRRQLKLDDLERGDLVRVDWVTDESATAYTLFRYDFKMGVYIC